MLAVAKAVAAGENEVAEFAKVIAATRRRFKLPKLDERVTRVEELSDAELMRVALGGSPAESFPPFTRLLTVGSR